MASPTPRDPMRSPPTSPPAAKRARLDPDETFSTLPPSSPTTSTPAKLKSNGYTTNTVPSDPPPLATSAPLPEELKKSAIDQDVSDDEEPVPVTKMAEEEDLSRKDMYLDTVSHLHISGSVKLILDLEAKSGFRF